MGKKSKKIRGGGLVYSTDPETMSDLFSGIKLNQGEDKDENTPADMKKKQYDDEVRVWIDRKGRGGKEVTLVKGIGRPDSYLKDIAKDIKSQCGVGGTAKNGEIIIQGNHRDKVVDILKKKGFVNTKKAGG